MSSVNVHQGEPSANDGGAMSESTPNGSVIDRSRNLDVEKQLQQVTRQLQQVTRCETLMDTLNVQSPKIAWIMHNAPVDALQWLQTKNAVCAKEAKLVAKVEETGTDNAKTWHTYLLEIERYLDFVIEDPWLALARKEVAELLHQKHYDRFPFWPCLGQEQSSHIAIDMGNRTYEIDDVIVMTWVGGSATVTDKRPALEEYRAEFNGQPHLRALNIKKKRLQELEELVGSRGPQGLLEDIRSSGHKQLTWDHRSIY